MKGNGYSAWLTVGLALCGCSQNAAGSPPFVEYVRSAPPATATPRVVPPVTIPPGDPGVLGQGAAGTANTANAAGSAAVVPPVTVMPGLAGSPANVGGMGGAPGAGGVSGTAGASGGGGGGGTAPTGPKPTKLVISVTTLQQDGKWRPQNAGVLFIEDATGKWVRTLEVWASTNVIWLTRYGQTQGAPLYNWDPFTPIPPDVVTSVTLKMHTTHTRTWDLKDVNGREVPDGIYKVVIDLTDRDKVDGVSQEYPFMKGPSPMTLTPPDAQYYTGAKLSLE